MFYCQRVARFDNSNNVVLYADNALAESGLPFL